MSKAPVLFVRDFLGTNVHALVFRCITAKGEEKEAQLLTPAQDSNHRFAEIVNDGIEAYETYLTGVIADLMHDNDTTVRRIRESVLAEVLSVLDDYRQYHLSDVIRGTLTATLTGKNPEMLPPDKIREQRDTYRRALEQIVADYDRPLAFDESPTYRWGDAVKMATNALEEGERLGGPIANG